MKLVVIAAIAVTFGIARTASASPLMIATCLAPTGLNISAETERDKPKDSVSEVYDPAAGAYVSHPRNTHGSIITVNRDGTATEVSFFDNGSSIATDMHILGSLNNEAISLTDGTDGHVNLLTLYPKESVAIFAGTSYFGWHKAIATGYVYISHCRFSVVMQ